MPCTAAVGLGVRTAQLSLLRSLVGASIRFPPLVVRRGFSSARIPKKAKAAIVGRSSCQAAKQFCSPASAALGRTLALWCFRSERRTSEFLSVGGLDLRG